MLPVQDRAGHFALAAGNEQRLACFGRASVMTLWASIYPDRRMPMRNATEDMVSVEAGFLKL